MCNGLKTYDKTSFIITNDDKTISTMSFKITKLLHT